MGILNDDVLNTNYELEKAVYKLIQNLTSKMFKVNNKGTGVFIVNFEHISPLVLVFLLLTLNIQLPTRAP